MLRKKATLRLQSHILLRCDCLTDIDDTLIAFTTCKLSIFGSFRQ